VRIGKPGARSFDDDDAQAEPFGGTPALSEELATRAESAVEPEHDRALGIAEFCVAKTAAVGKMELTFGPRLFDARDTGRVMQWVVH
jgi:hypothetical protein